MGAELGTDDALSNFAGMKIGDVAESGNYIGKNINITGFTSHGVNRAIGSFGRIGVKPNSILDALKNPLKVNNIVTD